AKGAGDTIPSSGCVFVSVRDVDKDGIVAVAASLVEQGFSLVATRGTHAVLERAGLEVKLVNKVAEGRPHIVDMIKNDEISMIINTTEGRQATKDSASIRRSAENHFVYYTTTLAGGEAVSQALHYGSEEGSGEQVRSLQSLHKRLA
ncbi:MAG: carbamoyl-phosphate synthase large subunit, partial [Kiritimatiellia bacterium]